MSKSSELMADVSSNNGHIDIAQYSRAGHAAIAIKASQGTGYENPFHDSWSNQAHRFGLTVIHYHFCDASSIQYQIDKFRHVYHKAWRKGDYACFDIETPGLDASFASSILHLYYVETQNFPIFYTYQDDLNNQLRGTKVPGGRLWIANYSSNPLQIPGGYTVWARQYTDGSAGPEPHFYSGIGNCDGSRITAGVAKALYLRKLATRRKR